MIFKVFVLVLLVGAFFWGYHVGATDLSNPKQEVYDSLIVDWQNCYAAVLCDKYPETCLVWIEENTGKKPTSSVELITEAYVSKCEESDLRWDEYLGNHSFYKNST